MSSLVIREQPYPPIPIPHWVATTVVALAALAPPTTLVVLCIAIIALLLIIILIYIVASLVPIIFVLASAGGCMPVRVYLVPFIGYSPRGVR